MVICSATASVCCRRPLHGCCSHKRTQQDSRRQARAFTSRCAICTFAHLPSLQLPAARDAPVHVDTPLQSYHSLLCCCRGSPQLTAGSSAGQSSARNGGAGSTNHGLAPKAKLELTEAVQDLTTCNSAAPGAINGQPDLTPCEIKAAAAMLPIMLLETLWSRLQWLLHRAPLLQRLL